MTACREHAVELSLHAAGALPPEEASRLEAHLAGCAACRAAAAEEASLLDLARLPPPSEAERHATADLAARTLSTFRRSERRRRFGARTVAALAAVAAVALALAAPALLRRPALAPPAQARAEWQQPDLDTLWDDTAVLDVTASDGGDGTETALAALDTGEDL